MNKIVLIFQTTKKIWKYFKKNSSLKCKQGIYVHRKMLWHLPEGAQKRLLLTNKKLILWKILHYCTICTWKHFLSFFLYFSLFYKFSFYCIQKYAKAKRFACKSHSTIFRKLKTSFHLLEQIFPFQCKVSHCRYFLIKKENFSQAHTDPSIA